MRKLAYRHLRLNFKQKVAGTATTEQVVKFQAKRRNLLFRFISRSTILRTIDRTGCRSFLFLQKNKGGEKYILGL